MSWRPILEGEDRARARSVIDRLAEAYREVGPEPGEEADWATLARGEPGATARVWDAASGRLVSTLRGHAGPVLSVAFDATGESVATASEDGSADVWDRETGARVTALHGHGNTVYRAEFDPSGRRLLTASYDGTARLPAATRRVSSARPPARSRAACRGRSTRS